MSDDLRKKETGTDHCRDCGRSTVFLTYESQEDGRCAHCRLGVDRR